MASHSGGPWTPGWCRRLAEVDEDVAYRGRVGDEGDDAHLGAAERTHQREHFVDASQKQRPGVSVSATMDATSDCVTLEGLPVTSRLRSQSRSRRPH